MKAGLALLYGPCLQTLSASEVVRNEAGDSVSALMCPECAPTGSTQHLLSTSFTSPHAPGMIRQTLVMPSL